MLLLGNSLRPTGRRLLFSIGHAYGYGSSSSRRNFDSRVGEEGVPIDFGHSATDLASLLQSCSGLLLSQGQALHGLILLEGRDTDKLLCNLVIRMYGKCGSMEDAIASFHAMLHVPRNVFTWAILIGMYAEHGVDMDALSAFQQMLSEGVLPDKAVFVATLSACSHLRALREGKRLHSSIVSCGVFGSDHIVATTLLSMYGKCKCLDFACEVFAEMQTRNVVSWNAMMSAYVERGLGMDVRGMMAQMQAEAILADRITLVLILDLCADHGSLLLGQYLHTLCLHQGLVSDVVVGTALINMYAKFGSVEAARILFQGLIEQDIVSRSVMMSAYVQHGRANDALQLFRQILLEGEVPNVVMAITILDLCSDAQEGEQMHAFLLSCGLATLVPVSNALLKLYGKCGLLLSAKKAFDCIDVGRNVISWTEMIKVCVQQGQNKDARKHYVQMMMECVIPDDIAITGFLEACSSQEAFFHGKSVHSCCIDRYLDEVGCPLTSALISFYGKCGHLGEASQILFETSKQDVVSWSALIKAHADLRHGEDAFRLFAQMECEGLKPDRVCLITVLDVCTCNSALHEGKHIHNQIVDIGVELDVVVSTGLVAMYGKCGSLEDAQKTFNGLSNRNIISWNAIIGAYAQQGDAKQSLQLFSQMQMGGCVPDHVTFQNVLSVCRHGGLVEEGCQFLSLMCGDYGIIPSLDNFNSMADLLVRAGLLDKGEGLIKSMPCNPNTSSWITLMSACKQHLDITRGADAAGHALKLDSKALSPYVLLSNIYCLCRGVEVPHLLEDP